MSRLIKTVSSFLTPDLLIPMLLVLTYLVFALVLRKAMPTSEELVVTFERLFARYGYEIVFFASLAEALVLVNLFTPGMMTMALGAVFAHTNRIELAFLVLFASAGALLGYLLDYFLGYFGFSDIINKLGYGKLLVQGRGKLLKFGNRALILGFSYPNVASVFSLAAGTISLLFSQFFLIAAVSTLVWMSLWALVIYISGGIILLIITRYSFLLVILVLLGLILSRLAQVNLKSKQ